MIKTREFTIDEEWSGAVYVHEGAITILCSDGVTPFAAAVPDVDGVVEVIDWLKWLAAEGDKESRIIPDGFGAPECADVFDADAAYEFFQAMTGVETAKEASHG